LGEYEKLIERLKKHERFMRSRNHLPRGWRLHGGGKRAPRQYTRPGRQWLTELAVSCAIAAALVAGWFQWAPAEKTPTAATSNVTVAADTIVGHTSVIDGDTLDIHGQRIRILDIDAPESKQTCTATDGSQWRCGQKAALALFDWIGSRTVACEPTGKDRYGRWLAHCSVGGADVAEWLASNGWAIPYRDCKCEVVRAAAAQAKAGRRGIWTSTFQMPWDWRKGHAR
jgi:endonuclease YncB( thermonuclease family)